MVEGRGHGGGVEECHGGGATVCHGGGAGVCHGEGLKFVSTSSSLIVCIISSHCRIETHTKSEGKCNACSLLNSHDPC